ncbi:MULTISPECIES: hypothetical protein [unclassified Aureispira]|uniref:hypothetical protein n=1 Tax=unclassified Aureispira TaxID=2649989 RepID=UPI000695DD2E|nr:MULTISPECIES: hypothetical protein [unclassified Aureispira]WMX15707.1 hypothetical protein QP953_04840 [Aureispira sp. CCB-E]
MLHKNILLSFLFLFITFQYSFSQSHVSQYLHQILATEQDPETPPSTMYLKLHTSRVEIQQMKGTRLMVTGKVLLGIPNVFFLDVLIEKGRYELFLSADGGSGLRLEDKSRQPMILQGEQCREEVSYVIYIPETVTTVAFEDAVTGETRVLPIKKREQPLASSAPPASAAPQVFIKDK